MMWIYVTEDVIVKGESTDKDDEYMYIDTERFNLLLKKGWNSFVVTQTEGRQGEYETNTISYDSNADASGFMWLSSGDMGLFNAKAPHKGLIERLNR
jgi:hypothetical protein